MRSAAVQQVVRKMLAAPFAGRVVKVDRAIVGQRLCGRSLGASEPSVVAHLAKRVLLDEQWHAVTTPDEFVEDLRQAIRHREARFVRYRANAGRVCIGCFAPNTVPLTRLGTKPEASLWVLYDADRDKIISGYQVSELARVSIPEDARWL